MFPNLFQRGVEDFSCVAALIVLKTWRYLHSGFAVCTLLSVTCLVYEVLATWQSLSFARCGRCLVLGSLSGLIKLHSYIQPRVSVGLTIDWFWVYLHKTELELSYRLSNIRWLAMREGLTLY